MKPLEKAMTMTVDWIGYDMHAHQLNSHTYHGSINFPPLTDKSRTIGVHSPATGAIHPQYMSNHVISYHVKT